VLLQASSPEMGVRTASFTGAGNDFQPSLAMSCFWLGPCSVFLESGDLSRASEQGLASLRA